MLILLELEDTDFLSDVTSANKLLGPSDDTVNDSALFFWRRI